MAIPEQPFGFVAGRWVLSLADTPMDADRAPDYKPLYPGSVIFNNKLSHRVVGDGEGGSIGIVKTRYEAKLNEDGKLIDAEEHEFVALPVGVYSVSFSFGQYSWPQFDFELTAEHTLESPFWLPSESPIPSGPGVVKVVSEEARLAAEAARFAAEAAAASAWEAVDTPGRQGIQGVQGIQGPKGDMDSEQLAGAPRLTNLVHDITWVASAGATIDSQTPRLAKFTATASSGWIEWSNRLGVGVSYYFTAEVKTTSDRVFFGSSSARAYHSGSGDWERLSGSITPSGKAYLLVMDTRSSGWDQIEVRDPVLINLTAVFGAGREPTKEYMDALLAKHGHYIGGVDQFAVGDALRALTVAGQGMGVRVDTTVGTRVFLDHPSGSTMLYGDTGVRDITSGLINGWTAESMLLSRVGKLCTLTIFGLNATNATNANFFSPVNGFYPNGSWRGSIFTTNMQWFRMTSPWSIPSYSSIKDNIQSFITWETVSPWPTTLPGTPR